MNNYFTLTLDTTGPIINIIAPSYTTPQTSDEISIVANETLSTYQEFYIVDSAGVRHDLTFDYEGDRFVGLVSFSGYPFGTATIYARVKDEVMNISELVSKTISIRLADDTQMLRLEISDRCAAIEIDDRCVVMNIQDRSARIDTSENQIKE